MPHIFISYARPNEPAARLAGEALRNAGYEVWRDDELPAHRAYSEVIEERIREAKAVLVLWSADAARSQWVRAEADAAREAGTLVQVSLDGSMPPMPFNQIQCADLRGWNGDTDNLGWAKALNSISSLAGAASAPDLDSDAPAASAQRMMVCVVPFQNMSGDLEQEYFSDGISEDIIIDLSKVSSLGTVPRNLAFELKGKRIDTAALAHDLGVTHVLEGSVRKAGSRVRITAELIDCRKNEQLWGDRYDRDLDDIFAIQDEISKAIVAALQLKLLPKEKKAIEQRGTSNPQAYKLYLMARQHWISGNDGEPRRDEVVVRICRQATAVDPKYAKAWALMALAQSELRFRHDRVEVDPLPAAEQALALDPNMPEAICVKARYLESEGKVQEASDLLDEALQLDPESWEANKEAARLVFRQGRTQDAIAYYEKAASLVDTDYHDMGLLVTCYMALGDEANMQRTARATVARAEKAVAQDPTNGSALGMGAIALAALGDEDRTREWVERAVLVDPDNLTVRYNLACALANRGDADGALDLLGPYFEGVSANELGHSDVDPDMDPIRDDPRFIEMTQKARARLKAEGMMPATGATTG